MTDPRDLSGHWEGFYIQHGRERPVSADLTQDGDHLAGEMRDEELVFETSVAEMAMEEGLPPGADERIVEQVRSLLPGGGALPVHAEVLVPPRADVEGEVAGDAVRFTKTYRGLFFAGYRIGDLRVGVGGEDQEVQYRGRISPDGREIEGRWLLPESAARGLLRPEGGFVLRRVGEPNPN
jgi:hypothetical protein